MWFLPPEEVVRYSKFSIISLFSLQVPLSTVIREIQQTPESNSTHPQGSV